MDWGKAKTQMIYVFVILNIFLGYLLWKSTGTKTDSFDVKKELAPFEIKVDCALPHPKTAPSLRLQYHLYTREEIEDIFFQDPAVVDKKDILVFTEGYKEVVLINKKLLRYSNTPTDRPDKIRNLGDAEEEAKNFLKHLGLDQHLVLSHSSYKYDLYSVEFGQVDPETNLFLESAFTIVQVGENGVVSMERQVFDKPKEQEGNLTLRDPARKLLKISNFPEAKGKTIVDVKVCYIFDPGKNPYVNNPEKAAGGVANIGLRVRLDDGLVLLLN